MSLAPKVVDGSGQHLDVVVELSKSVVAVVAQPAPELVGGMVVVQHNVLASADVLVADRASQVVWLAVLSVEPSSHLALLLAALGAGVLSKDTAGQRVVDRELAQLLDLVAYLAFALVVVALPVCVHHGTCSHLVAGVVGVVGGWRIGPGTWGAWHPLPAGGGGL